VVDANAADVRGRPDTRTLCLAGRLNTRTADIIGSVESALSSWQRAENLNVRRGAITLAPSLGLRC
jgi:hypothetical protein